jgi:hypothetical protein
MTTKEAALAAIDDADVHAGQTWQHVKGRFYTVIATGIDEATLLPVVIYAGCDGVVWVRALTVFLGTKDGRPRFVRVYDHADDVDTTAPFQKSENAWDPSDVECLVNAAESVSWPKDPWGSGQPLGIGVSS